MFTQNSREHRLIIIDSDNEYGQAFTSEASDLGYRVDYFKNVMDVGFLGNLSKYDAALIGENIGQLSPMEMADYFGKVLDKIPIILLTSSDLTESLPESVKGVSKKHEGVETIVRKAFNTIDFSKTATLENSESF